MIPGLAPAIILRPAGGGLLDGYEDDFSTDRVGEYSLHVRADQPANPSAGTIAYNAALPALRFTQAIAWAGVSTPGFAVQPGAQYLIETIHDNHGPSGQGEVSITAGPGTPAFLSLGRGSANRAGNILDGTVTATGPLMAVFLGIRGGGNTVASWRLARATRL